MYKRLGQVTFENTNECLDAILYGMAITHKDNVLSICGSGDQPLAILEQANSVTAIDNNIEQIDYFKYRTGLIRAKQYEEFRLSSLNDATRKHYSSMRLINDEDNNVMRTIKYFTNHRLELIRQKLDKLIIHKMDIFDYEHPTKKHNKIYLSNAIGYESESEKILSFLDAVKTKTVIYCSKKNDFYDEILKSSNLRNCFREKTRLTQIANDLEDDFSNSWKPIILEKIRK